MFYDLEYDDISYQIDKFNLDRYFNILVSRKGWHRDCEVPIICMRHTALYTAEFSNVFLSIDARTAHNLIRCNFDDYIGTIKPKSTIGYYPIGIYYRQTHPQWGHLMHDFLGAMVYVPEFIKKIGAVVVTPPSGFDITQRFMREFGIDKFITQISLNSSQQIFVNKLYFLSTLHNPHGYTIGGIMRLRKILFEKYQIDSINATRYVFMNRLNGSLRHVLNFKQWYDHTIKYDPMKNNWEIEKLNEKDFSASVKTWSTFKVLITVCGSNINNCMAMKPESGLLLAMAHARDMPNIQLAAVYELKMVGVAHKNVRHFDQTPEGGFNVNITAMMNGLNVLYKLMVNKAYKDESIMKEFDYPVNIGALKEMPDIEIEKLRYLVTKDISRV